MTTLHAVNDTAKVSAVESTYPVRQSHFAHRFTRLVFKSCAAQDLGHHAALLLVHIAHTEDAARYRGPVRFWNSQLLETLGLSSERALRTARERAIDSRWLHYERESNRQVGRYWVLIPRGVDAFDDSPIEPNGLLISGRNTGANDGNTSGFMAGDSPDSMPENRRKTALPSNPFPAPDPIPIQEGANARDRLPRKPGRSPPALVVDSPPFEDIEQHWNDSLGVHQRLTATRREKLKSRWKDAEFRTRWRDAIARISRSYFCRGMNDRGWKADLEWFLKVDTVTKVLEGKYDNHKNATYQTRGNSFAIRERANADAFATVFGPDNFETGSGDAAALLLNETDDAIHTPPT